MQSLINQYVANLDENKGFEIAQTIANKISNQECKFLDLVIGLREYITSDSSSQRCVSLQLLSSVIGNLSSMTPHDIAFIYDFYKSKMDDTACMKQTLEGFSELCRMKSFSFQTDLVQVLHQYDPKKHLAAVRYYGFVILDRIFHVDAKFVDCFLHIATGEKDPRNLMESFKLNMRIAQEADDSKLPELFDVLFCYFPITFKPPKNDPYKITNADLKLALRAAIASTSRFEADAWDNLIEKFTASSPSVKNDTMLTLTACIENYGFDSVSKYWLQVWNTLKFEIIHNDEDDDEFKNYTVSLGVVSALAQQMANDEDAFEKFLLHIFGDLKANIVNSKDLKQSCGILSAIAGVNTFTFDSVVQLVFPLFFVENEDIHQLKNLMLNLAFFFQAYLKIGATSSPTLENYRDRILLVLGQSFQTSQSDLKALSIGSYSTLIKMNFLSEDEICMVLQYLTESVLGDESLYQVSVEGIRYIADSQTHLVLETLEKISEMPTSNLQLTLIIDLVKGKQALVDRSLQLLSSKLLDQRVASTVLTILAENETQAMDLEPKVMELTGSCNDDNLLDCLASILFYIYLRTDPAQHQSYLDKFLPDLSTPSRSVIVSVKVLAALDISTKLDAVSVIKNVVSILSHNMTSFERVQYLQLLALVVNKWLPDNEETPQLPVEILTWYGKGLISKCSPKADAIIDTLIKELDSADISSSFHVLFMDLFCLKKYKKNNKVRLLYKQKYFDSVATRLVSGYSSEKPQFLMALSLVLQNIPKSIALPYMKTLIPLLIQALTVSNAVIKVAALETIKVAIDGELPLIVEYYTDMLPLLQQLIVASATNTETVRLLALECLSGLVFIPINHITPHKENILRSLALPLDDKKRSVRKLAIDTRQKYYELGQQF